MAQNPEKIVCRFAPSPTGFLHVGGARSALFNYLFARQRGGKLILRIEDTDKERSTEEYERDILEGFRWLSLEFDETLKQSERNARHVARLRELIDAGRAYVSKESDTKEGQRSEVIRFKNPNKRVAFDDLIKGRITFDTTELGDFVIAKSLTEPIYHLANVVDDADEGVTHVIRGEEHISNTPRQLLIWEAFGAPPPRYAHIPLILASDRSKLSKRKHGESVSLKFYREQGYLPEALLNYLAFLGWNPGDERERMSREELVRDFRLEKVQKGGAIFSREKLDWMNREYLSRLPAQEVLEGTTKALASAGKISDLADWQKQRLADAIRDRVHYFGEAAALAAAGEFDYLLSAPPYDVSALLWKNSPDRTRTRRHLGHIVNVLKKDGDRPSPELVKNEVLPYAEKEGKGEVLWPFRFALSGRPRSLDPFNLVAILGKNESVSRVMRALDLLQ